MSRTESGAQLLYNDRSWTRRSNLRTRLFRALHACHALCAVDAEKVKRRSRHPWAWGKCVQNGWHTCRAPHACSAPPPKSVLSWCTLTDPGHVTQETHAMHALHTDHSPKCIRIGRRQSMAPSNVGMSGTSRMSRAARICRATGVPQVASWGTPPVSVPGLPLCRTRHAMKACNALHACHALRNRRQPQKSAQR